MVPYFTTFSTVMFDVFPTGVSTTMFEVLFISYKLLIVPGLYPRLYIYIRQSFSHRLSKHFVATAKNKYVLFLYCLLFSIIEFRMIRLSTANLYFLPAVCICDMFSFSFSFCIFNLLSYIFETNIFGRYSIHFDVVRCR